MRTELLGNLISISKGRKHDLSVAGKRYIQIEDLRHCENIKYTAATSGTEVKCSDLVIVWDGAYSGLVSYGLEGLIGSTLARLRPVDGYDVYTPYLGHLLKTKFDYLQSQCTGATIPHVSKHSLVSIEVPLPPLPEQKRIAAILDKADEIRRKREKAIELTDSFLRSVFLEMFSKCDKTGAEMERAPLSSLLARDFQNGAYYPKETYTEDGSGVEMVHMSDAFYGLVAFDKIKRVSVGDADVKKYSLSSDDILIARRSLSYEGAAKPCRVPILQRPLIFESSLIRVTPNKDVVHPLYLFFYLSEPIIRRRYLLKHITQSTISGINQANLSQVQVIVPPMSDQLKFVSVFIKIDALKERLLRHCLDCDALSASLSHALLEYPCRTKHRTSESITSAEEAHAL